MEADNVCRCRFCKSPILADLKHEESIRHWTATGCCTSASCMSDYEALMRDLRYKVYMPEVELLRREK